MVNIAPQPTNVSSCRVRRRFRLCRLTEKSALNAQVSKQNATLYIIAQILVYVQNITSTTTFPHCRHRQTKRARDFTQPSTFRIYDVVEREGELSAQARSSSAHKAHLTRLETRDTDIIRKGRCHIRLVPRPRRQAHSSRCPHGCGFPTLPARRPPPIFCVRQPSSNI